jgi:hypothetical protein
MKPTKKGSWAGVFSVLGSALEAIRLVEGTRDLRERKHEYRIVTEVLQECYRGVTEVLQRCYRGVTGTVACLLSTLFLRFVNPLLMFVTPPQK